MILRLRSARAIVMAIALAVGSLGGMAAAHADYYHHGHRYHHRHFVHDHNHPHGYYSYY